MKPSEQGSFFQASRNESKEWYATTETYESINISMEFPITFKVNYILKHLLLVMLTSCFFGWRGVTDVVRVHQPARPIIRS